MNPHKSQQKEASAASGMADQLDRKLAGDAYRKVFEGKQLSTREQTVLRRFEKEKEEKLRWQFYETIPQKHWRTMSGRQTKVLNEQATLYGIPLGGATVNLRDVVRALHDFLAANARRLAGPEDDLLQGAPSPALERYREERAALAKLERLEREGKVLGRTDARTALGRIASRLRSAGETLERQFGSDARAILDEALDDAERDMETTFGDSDASADQAEPALD